MAQRIVVVGGVAAGASAAAKARRSNEEAEIIVFESGPYMSYANCGLPYYMGGEIANRDALLVVDADTFTERFNVDVRLDTRIVSVSAADRQVTFVGPNGAETSLAYDRLVLATGTVPLVPPVEGLGGPSIFFCRTIPDVDAVMRRLGRLLPRDMEGGHFLHVRDTGIHALVIGGGYIGLECAEQLLDYGVRITVVEMKSQVMGPIDAEMAHPVQLALEDAGGAVILNDGVERIDGVGNRSKAVLQSGREIVFDIAIVGTGVRPNVELAKAAGVKLGKTGAIAVDAWQRTSDPAIFAAGDNCESVFLPTGEAVNIPLAGPANKQGRVAGHNAALDLLGTGEDDPSRLRMGGVLGTSIVRVCGTVAGGTGLSEKVARRSGIDVATAYVIGPDHAGYYPSAKLMLLKLIYAPDSGRVLGAQVVGEEGVDKRIDVLATAIQGEMTLEDLEDLDLAYAPPFGSAKDVEIMIGFIAANAWRGTSPGISPLALFEALAGDHPPLVIDVRSRREYENAHLEGAVNVPLEELRQRLDEVPKDRPLVVHCTMGYRSYLSQQILLHHGWTDVRNLYGGYGLAKRIQAMRQAGQA